MATPKARKRVAQVEALVRRMSATTGSNDRRYRVTLDRSPIGGTQRQRATLACLGLRRRGAQVVVPDTPQARGRIRAVAHLVVVEDL